MVCDFNCFCHLFPIRGERRVKRNGRGSRAKNIVLIALLALFCIGGTELAFCRVEDPELFNAVVAPAVKLYRGAETRVLAARDAVHARAQAWSEARALAKLERERARAAALEAQIASDPAVRAEYVPADPAITELVVEDGQEYLLGGNYTLTYYNQSDSLWAERPFGVDPIGGYGCGPTALAMAVSSMTEQPIDPAEMAAWAAGMGYAAPHSGSYLSIVEGAAAYYGLNCVSPEVPDADALCDLLAGGGVFVALMGPGHFTKGGHFILLHGVTLSGEILVADPNSRENSLMTWDPQLLLDELSEKSYDGSPLWLLTVPDAL